MVWLVGFVGLGAIVLAGVAWLAVLVLPDAPEDLELDLGPQDPEPESVDLLETGLAAPEDAVVDVDRCEVSDGVIAAAGRFRNTSGRSQAFLLRLTVVVDGRLFDGTTTEMPLREMIDGASRDWEASIGAVDADAPPESPPTCAIDRIGLAQELAG